MAWRQLASQKQVCTAPEFSPVGPVSSFSLIIIIIIVIIITTVIIFDIITVVILITATIIDIIFVIIIIITITLGKDWPFHCSGWAA